MQELISIGNRTEWSPIRSVIIQVITSLLHHYYIHYQVDQPKLRKGYSMESVHEGFFFLISSCNASSKRSERVSYYRNEGIMIVQKPIIMHKLIDLSNGQ